MLLFQIAMNVGVLPSIIIAFSMDLNSFLNAWVALKRADFG